jgi:hypothetical protein
LISDHPGLAEFLLERLALEIVTFAQKEQEKQERHKRQKALSKTVADFYLNAILPHRRRFISALLRKLPRKNEEEGEPPGIGPSFYALLDALQFYFNRMEVPVVEGKAENNKKSSEETSEGQKMDETKEKAEYLTIRVDTLG